MTIRPLPAWPTYFPRVRRKPTIVARKHVGAVRALTLEEQLEIQRTMREAAPYRHRQRTALDLAERYGISRRTVYRYAEAAAPTDHRKLRLAILRWADEREMRLTHDDVTTLIAALSRVTSEAAA